MGRIAAQRRRQIQKIDENGEDEDENRSENESSEEEEFVEVETLQQTKYWNCYVVGII